MLSKFPTAKSAAFFLSGPAGPLETLTTWPSAHSPSAVGIICHPHPLFGGTMHNKVVTTVAKAFEELHVATLRFNFRGIGQSAGVYGDMQGEIADLQAVLNWVKEQLPDIEIWLAGFSFGAYIAAAVANHNSVARLISIAPAVNHASFENLTNIKCPWLVVQGTEDEVVPYELVKKLADHPPSSLKFISLPGVSHFFHGKLKELKDTLVNELS